MNLDALTFQHEVDTAGEAVRPARANILLAHEVAYPDLAVNAVLAQLADLADQAAHDLNTLTPVARAHAIPGWLGAQGFAGDASTYDDPRNSYLNEVLTRKQGLPIALSALALEVAYHLQAPLVGVGLPGHFIVAVEDDDGAAYYDPFHGGQYLTLAECAARVRTATGHTGAFNPRWLRPTAPRDMVARMLNNLRNHYTRTEDWALAVRVAERLRELQPNLDTHWRDLGLLYFRTGALSVAAHWLTAYLTRSPNADDAEAVRKSRDMILDQLARLN